MGLPWWKGRRTPQALRAIWEKELNDFGDLKDAGRLSKALQAALPKAEDQILALYAWLGSGEGPWLGYPSYESVAEKLLLDYPVKELIAAIHPEKMSAAQMERAARLLGGWDFSQKHPDGLKPVPAAVKAALWEHTKGTKDKDKLERAERAFAPEQE